MLCLGLPDWFNAARNIFANSLLEERTSILKSASRLGCHNLTCLGIAGAIGVSQDLSNFCQQPRIEADDCCMLLRDQQPQG